MDTVLEKSVSCVPEEPGREPFAPPEVLSECCLMRHVGSEAPLGFFRAAWLLGSSTVRTVSP